MEQSLTFKVNESCEMVSLGIFCRSKPYLLDLPIPQRTDALINYVGLCGKNKKLAFKSHCIFNLFVSFIHDDHHGSTWDLSVPRQLNQMSVVPLLNHFADQLKAT